MSILKQWIKKSKASIFDPKGFYGDMKSSSSYKVPLNFVGTSAAIISLFLAVLSFFLNLSSIKSGLSSFVAVFFFMFSLSLIGFLTEAFTTHIFTKLLGGKKTFETSLEVLSYPSVLVIIFGLIPGLNILTGLYYIYVSSIGLASLQEISHGKAVAAILLGGIFSWIPIIILLIIMGGAIGGIAVLLGA